MLPIEYSKKRKAKEAREAETARLIDVLRRVAAEHYHTTNMTERDVGYIIRDADMVEIRRLLNGV